MTTGRSRAAAMKIRVEHVRAGLRSLMRFRLLVVGTVLASLVVLPIVPVHRLAYALPAADRSCSGVRPGAEILVFEDDLKDPRNANGPTMNFVFAGSDGYRYVGLAGHSVADRIGAVESWGPGEGALALDGNGRRIGRIAFVALTATQEGFDSIRDFALVRLDRGVTVNPAVCVFGGPSALYRERSSSPVILRHYGQGDVVEDVSPGRTAVALRTTSEYHVFAEGVINGGDSGSPFVTEDRAVGHLSGTCLPACIGGSPPPSGRPSGEIGHLLILRTRPQLALAERTLGVRLRLVTTQKRK